MKTFGHLSVLMASASTILSTVAYPSLASGKFYCGSFSSVPATLTTSRSGKVIPIILWKSEAFSADGWSPERRCQEVSQRFNSLHSQGALNYLSTGRMNGMPVICAASSEGNGCSGLLYTLKPGQNASQTLKSLLAVRYKATGPLTETSSRLYISMDQLIEGEIASADVTSQSGSSNQGASTTTVNRINETQGSPGPAPKYSNESLW